MEYYINEDKSIRLYNGDCIDVMDKLIEQSVKVDAIITDPPYGTTACKWDSVLPFNKYIETYNKSGKKSIMYEDEYLLQQFKTTVKPYQYILDEFNEQAKDGMWERLNKLIKPNGAIVLFGSEPFSSALRMSNIKNYKYDWVWNKVQKSNFLNAKKQPLRSNELISIFYKKQCIYNPQITKGHRKKEVKNIQRKTVDLYNKQNGKQNYSSTERYPHTIITFPKDTQKSSLHPTQKPVALMEYLIKTYTNETETVLDFTMGSGTTGVACVNTNRKFIGIELDEKYSNIARERIVE